MPEDPKYFKENLGINKEESADKNEIRKEQSKFRVEQTGDMLSELNKLHRRFKKGEIKTLAEYESKRKEIIKKYNVTKKEIEQFIGKKFAS